MSAVLVDTNVLIWVLKDDRRHDPVRKHLSGRDLMVSFATIGELCEGWRKRGKTDDQITEKLLETMARATVVPFNKDVCCAWGKIREMRRANRRTLSENDAWIAATAAALNIPLVTMDSDLQDTPCVEILYEPML